MTCQILLSVALLTGLLVPRADVHAVSNIEQVNGGEESAGQVLADRCLNRSERRDRAIGIIVFTVGK